MLKILLYFNSVISSVIDLIQADADFYISKRKLHVLEDFLGQFCFPPSNINFLIISLLSFWFPVSFRNVFKLN